MTDKQIIINGVDVSGCEFLISNNDKLLCRCIKSDLFGGIEFVENAKNGNCKDNPNCYYKQLKAKEQECEAYKMEAEEGEEINAELKAENEELKKQIDITQMFLDACNNSCEHYKQTLTEIKEIAEQILDDDDNHCPFELTQQILQKISEVEDGSNN